MTCYLNRFDLYENIEYYLPAQMATIPARHPLMNFAKLHTLPDFGMINFHVNSTTNPLAPHANNVLTTADPRAISSPR